MSAEFPKSGLQQTLSLEQMMRAVISAFNKIWQGRKWVVITALLGGVIALNGLWVSPSKYRAELMLAVEEGESWMAKPSSPVWTRCRGIESWGNF